MRPYRGCLALLAVLASAPAAAADYSYVDLGAVNEQRPAALTGRGSLLAVSLGLNEHTFLFGEYEDESAAQVTLRDHALGLGAHWMLDEYLDLSVGAGWAAKAAPLKTDQGWLAKLPLRWTPLDDLEIEPGIWRTAPGRGVNQLYADVRYRFADSWVVGAGLAHGDGDRLLRVYIRLYL
jgi:hypothetical protein